MRCNIDARGKAIRLVIGFVFAACGFALILVRSDSALIAGIVLIAFGVVAIFEGWAGWCVVRAMGSRTRI